ERVARLSGAAEAVREAAGVAESTIRRAEHEQNADAARAALGEAAFAAAWTEGRALGLEEAVRYALAPEEPTPPAAATAAPGPPAARSADPLSPREREVALLVAQGMTDRQIGEALVIARGTVGLHVVHILDKLGFRSRA